MSRTLGFHVGRVHLRAFRDRAARGEHFQQVGPEPASAPSVQAVVDRGRWAVLGRAVAPTAAGLQNVDDTGNDAAIVNAAGTGLVRRQVRLDCRSLRVGQPEQVLRRHARTLNGTNAPLESSITPTAQQADWVSSLGSVRQPIECGGEVQCAGEACGGLREPEGDRAHVLEPGPQVLDLVAPSVGGPVVVRKRMGSGRGHARLGTHLFDHAPPRGGRVGAVAGDTPDRTVRSHLPAHPCQEQRSRFQFAGLSVQQLEGQRQAVGVAGNDRFCAEPAARTTQRLSQRPPFAPAAFWCARIEVPSMKTSLRSAWLASRRCSNARCHTPA